MRRSFSLWCFYPWRFGRELDSRGGMLCVGPLRFTWGRWNADESGVLR